MKIRINRHLFLLFIASSMISTIFLNPNMSLAGPTMLNTASEVNNTLSPIVVSSPANITMYTTDTNVTVVFCY